jgi:hypothetical protein
MGLLKDDSQIAVSQGLPELWELRYKDSRIGKFQKDSRG